MKTILAVIGTAGAALLWFSAFVVANDAPGLALLQAVVAAWLFTASVEVAG